MVQTISPQPGWLPDPKWEPLHHTPRKYPMSRGELYCDFAELFLTAERGMRKGEPLRFEPWQRWLLDLILEERPDGTLRFKTFLLLLPRKNGKSLIGSTIALGGLAFGDAGTQVYSAARDSEQAKIVYDFAVKQVKKSKLLSKQLTVRADMVLNAKGGYFKPLSAEAKGAQGLGPEYVIADELHVWTSSYGSTRGKDMWDALTTGSSDREEYLVLGITTAGDGNDKDLLTDLVAYGMKVASGEVEDDSFGFAMWAADESDDIADEATWYKANPNLASGLMKIGDLRAAWNKAKAHNVNAFKRFHLNQFVSVGGANYLPFSYWAANARPDRTLNKGARIALGFDGSKNDDSTGFVAYDLDNDTMYLLDHWENDKNRSDWVVPRKEVKAAMERIMKDYRVMQVFADESRWQEVIEEWAAKWRGKVHKVPQNKRMIDYGDVWRQDMIDGKIYHSEDVKARGARLTNHIRYAVMAESGRPVKDKKGSKNKIDFVICMILAHAAAQHWRRKVATGRGGMVL